MTHRFNADTGALEQREAINQAGARHDLEAWIIAHLEPAPGQRILDLGCGRGKQIFALAPLVLPGGAILGVDVSPDAVDEVNRRAAEEGGAHVSAVIADLDACLGMLPERPFDGIVSTYAIYYASDVTGLLKGLRAHLTERGRAFHCGYGAGSNREMIEIINRVAEDSDHRIAPVEDFLSAERIASLEATYAQVTVVRLSNQIAFPDAEAVLRWWRNHNSFRPALAEAVCAEVAQAVAREGRFCLSKNVLGIRLDV